MTEEEKKLKIIAEILKTLCEIKEIKRRRALLLLFPMFLLPFQIPSDF